MDRGDAASLGRKYAGHVAALSPTEFASTVTAITNAFGDPTRREIYLFAHANPDGVTASDVAERFELVSKTQLIDARLEPVLAQ